MALAFSATRLPIKRYATGGYRFHLVNITFDALYAAGGYAIAASDVGLARNIAALLPGGVAGFVPVWNAATGKLLIYVTGSGSGALLSEAGTNQANLTGLVCTALVIGD